MADDNTPKRRRGLKPKALHGMKPGTVAPMEQELEGISRERARFEAGIIYTTDPDGLSVPDLRKDPRFADVPEATLYEWSKRDKWVERRKQVFEKIRQKAEAKIGSVLVKARMAEVEELMEVKDIAMTWIRAGLMPKSLEGLVKALIDLNTRREELSLSIMTEAMPGMQEGRSTGPAIGQSEFSVTEARELAHKAIAARRQTIRDELEKDAVRAGKDEDPEWVCGGCGFQSRDEAEFKDHQCGRTREEVVSATDATVDS
jgi:hypothetical protein